MAQTTKYHNVSVPEGIDLLKGDIKDLATKYMESTKMEEGEWGKFPPPQLFGLNWLMRASGLTKALKPIKGLYEAEKKTGGIGISLFETIAGDSSRRALLKKLMLSDKRMDLIKFKQMIKDAAEAGKRKAYKFPDMSKGSKAYKELEKEIAEIFSKHSTKHSTGGRIGFDDGGSTQKEIDKGIAAIEKLKPGLMPESYKALIELYKKKQKELDTGIMESAGGLGEMLGEGGRIGMENGGMPKWLLKILKEIEKVKTYSKDQKKLIRDLAYPGVDDFTKAEGGRIGFANGTTMDAFDSMTPNRRYMMTGESDVHRIMPPMGGILPMAGIAAVLALRKKGRDKDKSVTKKTKESKPPKKEPPKGSGILSEIVAEAVLSNKDRLEAIKDLIEGKPEGWKPTEEQITKYWEGRKAAAKYPELTGAEEQSQKSISKDRKLTDEEWKDYVEENSYELGPYEEELTGNETIAELDDKIAESRADERYWADQYKTGKLDDVMSMDAKIERVRSADDAGRLSGYSYDEEYEIREAADLKERIAVEKYEDAIKLDKAKESPWFKERKKNAAGGRIGLEEGGMTYEDFQQFMKDREKRDRGKSKQDLLDDWKKWQRWKKQGPGSIQEAKDGGIARRPNAVPPLSGPTPQGLTFLLGDDIVKRRIK